MPDLDDSPTFFPPPTPPQPPPAAAQEIDAAEENRPDPWADVPRTYRVHDDAVWQTAREDYLCGYSAEAVCAQHRLNLSTFRQRARREGWKKSDVGSPLPVPLNDAAEPEAAPPTPELVDLAWRSAAQSMKRGQVREARAWMKLWQELTALVREEEEAVRRAQAEARWQEQQAAQKLADEAKAKARAEAQAAVKAEAQLHPLHPDFGVQSDPDAEPGGVARQALCDALNVEIERGGHSPAIAQAIESLRARIAHSAATSASRGQSGP